MPITISSSLLIAVPRIKRDKSTGRVKANVQGFHADSTVSLDLRKLHAGADFLTTTHEGGPLRTTTPSPCAELSPHAGHSVGRCSTQPEAGHFCSYLC